MHSFLCLGNCIDLVKLCLFVHSEQHENKPEDNSPLLSMAIMYRCEKNANLFCLLWEHNIFSNVAKLSKERIFQILITKIVNLILAHILPLVRNQQSDLIHFCF